MALQLVYFDINVFEHMRRGIVSPEEVERVREARHDGKIAIILSYLNLEETLGMLDTAPPQEALEQLQFILDLVDWRRIVKPPYDFLADSIRSYAHGEPDPDPFAPVNSELKQALQNLTDPSPENLGELHRIAAQARAQKERFGENMGAASVALAPNVAELRRELHGKRPDFEEFCRLLELRCAESYAARVGVLQECSNRGIDGLLGIRSVRMAARASASLLYAYDFERKSEDPSDSRDLLHAVMATAGEKLVTQDGGLRARLAQIQIQNFRVLDMAGFVEHLTL